MANHSPSNLESFGKQRLDEVHKLADRLDFWAVAVPDIPRALMKAAATELRALRMVVLVAMTADLDLTVLQDNRRETE